MITREEALKYLNEKVQNKNIIKHMMALEAFMGEIYDALSAKGMTDLGGTKEEYMMAGLLHDGDYNNSVPVEKQGVLISENLRSLGFEIPDNIAHAMAAHNWTNTKVEPQSLMDWTIFCGDSLTGLIVACALVLPTKKLSEVTVEMVLKKFENKSFAGGTRREDIKKCEERLGFPLAQFVEISLKAMQGIAPEIGL
jgi:predicted hydrolase (HD superfamily)